MNNIEKVLVAVDGSDHAQKAVALAADIAAKHGADLLLVHVLLRQELPRDLQRIAEAEHLTEKDSPRGRPAAAVGLPIADLGSYVSLADGNAAMTDDVLRLVGSKVLDGAERLAIDHGAAKITRHIEDGKPVEVILAVAKSENADLIVTGARGLSTVKALVFGSISHKLAQSSPVTCITVH